MSNYADTCDTQLNQNISYSSIDSNFSVSSNICSNSSSRVYNFKNLPEPRNATEAYHSLQFDFELKDDLTIDENDLTANPNKRVKSNNNEEIQYHEIGYQYMQRNYTTSKMDLNYLLN
ncbi:hypothetical protein RhiirC2_716073 [Rhizophagus irregularis]|uniref:Uncharacterized protein n=1 Tax=Rhizophagus irregularis TaxID=588596 RepID=A0A2N1MSU8_9GLOM|nr:hypothetical protein RhiirC2_716073 [Rhizophagus irregularis]